MPTDLFSRADKPTRPHVHTGEQSETQRVARLAAIAEAFCLEPGDVDSFIEKNRALLSGLSQQEKRALWARLKQIDKAAVARDYRDAAGGFLAK